MYSFAKDIWSKPLLRTSLIFAIDDFGLQIADADLGTETAAEAILLDERVETESRRTIVPFIGSWDIFYTCAWCPPLGLEQHNVHTQLLLQTVGRTNSAAINCR